MKRQVGSKLDFFVVREREREREGVAFFRFQYQLHFSSQIKKIKRKIKIKKKAFLLKREIKIIKIKSCIVTHTVMHLFFELKL